MKHRLVSIVWTKLVRGDLNSRATRPCPFPLNAHRHMPLDERAFGAALRHHEIADVQALAEAVRLTPEVDNLDTRFEACVSELLWHRASP